MLVLAASLLVVVKQRDTRAAERDDRQRKIECLDVIIRNLRERAAQSDAAAVEMFLAVTPLIEKTDWTTGNYIGRIQYLRDQEYKRNVNVDSARRSLWNFPVIKEYIDDNGLSSKSYLPSVFGRTGL